MIETPHPITIQARLDVPVRAGIRLAATLYRPAAIAAPVPTIITLTPYMRQTYHDVGTYFARHGFAFLSVDVRGRGDSTGEFRPNIDEAENGYAVVEWAASQPFCNGEVVMWGGSYAGYAQWVTAKGRPPHLAAIAPAASPNFGIDFPMRNNIPTPYNVRWLAFVSGRASQDRIFADRPLWAFIFRDAQISDIPFADLADHAGWPSSTFREWLAHPEQGPFWDRYNPSPEDYAAIDIPVLSITGIYDSDQLGALAHFRQHHKQRPGTDHHLIIGPWDHAGTRNPSRHMGGLTFGSASVVDLRLLHVLWYGWVLGRNGKPDFLRDTVNYYMPGAEEWRAAPSLDAVATEQCALFLDSTGQADDVHRCGMLSRSSAMTEAYDSYVYDPADISLGGLEGDLDPNDLTDQTLALARAGRHLVYQTPAVEEPIEVAGFFHLSAWISIDQPDTDFQVQIHVIDRHGNAILLAGDLQRARYRTSLTVPNLVTTSEPLLYKFDGFPFTARRLEVGDRLRLSIGPLDSIHAQRNHNSGRAVAFERQGDARPVTVRLFHGGQRASILTMPITAQPVGEAQ